MASGSFNLTKSGKNSSGSYVEGRVVWSSTTNETGNYSLVTGDLYVRKDNDSTTLTIKTGGTWPYSFTIESKTVSGSVSKDVLTSWVKVATISNLKVSHKADGSKSITISGSVTGPTSTSLAGLTSSGSNAVNLDRIPHASTLDSVTWGSYFDENIEYKYTPQSASYYNSVRLSIKVGSGWIQIRRDNLGQKSASQQIGKITLSDAELENICKLLPNTDTTTARVSIYTFSDSGYKTSIGTGVHQEKALKIPTSVVPTGTISITPMYGHEWAENKGIYVAGYSSAKLTWSIEPGTGASLKSLYCHYVVNSTTKSTGDILDKTSLTLPAEGTGMIFWIYGYDSRDRFGETAVKSIKVYPYSNPAINLLQTERGTYDTENAAWAADDEGPDLKINFKTAISLGDQGNTYDAAFTFDGADKIPDYGTVSGLGSGTVYSVYFFGVDGESSYDLKVTTTDQLGNTGVATTTIPTISVTIEFNDSGKGIAFGKTSEHDAFECAWPAEFGSTVSIGDNQINDFVFEQGTSGIWTYRKWVSGQCELYAYHKSTIAIDVTQGGIYRSELLTVDLPFTVYEITPAVDCCDINAWASTNTYRVSEGNTTVTYVLFRGATYASNAWYTHIHIKGRWK